jgi:hypothetical protein
MAAWEDGWGQACPLAQRLKGAGADGVHTSNCARDILKAAENLGLVCSHARPYLVDIPGPGNRRIPMYLPHEIYAGLRSQHPNAELCLPEATLNQDRGLGAVLKEWAAHRDVSFEGDLTSVGMLGIHADGVQYTSSLRAGGGRSIIVASMNVVSAPSVQVRNLRLPLFVVRKSLLCNCGCQGFDTLQALFDVVAWSFRCLCTGIAPEVRHDGQPFQKDLKNRLAPGSRLPHAALLQIRGDWEWLVQCFRLRSFNSDNFCWMCQATKSAGPLCFLDMGEQAEHRNTLITHEDYFAECLADSVQPSHLFRAPGTQLQHIAVDTMHSADLGCFQDAIGSLFYLEIMHKPFHRNKAIGLKKLNEEIDFFYSAQNRSMSRVTPLVPTQIQARDPGHPYLKCKAAQTRHLVEFALILARRHQHGHGPRPPYRFKEGSRLGDRSDEHLNHLVAMFEGMARYTRACGVVPFPEAECKAGMYLFLQSLVALHSLWRGGLPHEAAKHMPFNVRVKSHVLQHVVEDKTPQWGSPSAFWCYRDEDYIGAVKGIARKTKHPFTLEKRILEKMSVWTKLASLRPIE